MPIEQMPPNSPNFKLILILACVALLAILVIAWIFLHFNSGNLGLRHHFHNPHAQLVLPAWPHPARLG